MGPMLLFTGYRSPDCDLFVEEKSAMVTSGILDYAFLALSRHSSVPKVCLTCQVNLIDEKVRRRASLSIDLRSR